jgi:predicted enzyme related to lactoylglutathione lyase
MALEIDYVEFQTPQIGESKSFFAKAFGWSYVDYGPDYAEIRDAGVTGGLETCEASARAAPLVILKADDLEAAQSQVEAAGGIVVKAIFPFPGGRRFHFREPGGNELAIWSEN